MLFFTYCVIIETVVDFFPKLYGLVIDEELSSPIKLNRL